MGIRHKRGIGSGLIDVVLGYLEQEVKVEIDQKDNEYFKCKQESRLTDQNNSEESKRTFIYQSNVHEKLIYARHIAYDVFTGLGTTGLQDTKEFGVKSC